MTATFAWNELKKMVVIDHEISRLRKTAKKEEALISSALADHQKKAATLHEAEATAKNLQKEIDRAELIAKDLRAQLSRKRQLQASAVSTKEQTALAHEITKVAGELDELDTTTLTLLEQLDMVKASVATLRTELAQAVVSLETLKACAQQKCRECLETITSLEKEWAELAPLVPENLRSEYLQLRSRLANPAAPITNESCSACFINLLPQELMHLTSRSVIRCRNCYRFLYLADATTQPLTEKSL